MTILSSSVTGGLCVFPLTPFGLDGAVDEPAFAGLVGRAVAAGVDSLGVLGSTGSYAYLDRADRSRVASLAVRHAAGTPVMVGIGAVSTRQVLQHLQDAQDVGAAAVLLSVLQYQRLSHNEVYGLFAAVDAATDVPIVIYDNPSTTGFTFTDELYARLAGLPHVAGIKIPPPGRDLAQTRRRIAQLRELLPDGIAIGVSGDASAAAALLGGADGWYSVVGGTFPEPAVALARVALAGDEDGALALDERMQPWWDLFAADGGSLRVIAAAAEEAGLVQSRCLPAPLVGLSVDARRDVVRALQALSD